MHVSTTERTFRRSFGVSQKRPVTDLIRGAQTERNKRIKIDQFAAERLPVMVLISR